MNTRPPDRPDEQEQPPSPEDMWDRTPAERLEQQREPSRMGRWMDSLRSRLPDRSSPFWSKTGQAVEQAGKRLAANEARAGKNPYLAAGIGGYEALRFGKQIYGFIKEERALAKLEEVRFKPLHKSLESERLGKEIEAEREAKRAFREAVKNKAREVPDSPYVGVMREQTLREPSRSVEERLSKIGNSSQGRAFEAQRLSVTVQEAHAFERNYLVGNPGDKYQYLAQKAVDDLGMKHFDRARYPERGMRFDQFAAERLYMDGYNRPEIANALREKSPFLAGADTELQASYVHTATRNFQPNFETPELKNARQALAEWRQQERLPEGYTHTPNEWRQVEPHMERATARQAAQFTEARLEQARAVWQEYRANPNRKLTTIEEYQVELARIHEHSSYPQNFDTRTSIKLMVAGHRADEVASALDKASPFSREAGYAKFQEGEYGRYVVGDAINRMEHDKLVQTEMQKILQRKEANTHLEHETRLDKLGMAYGEGNSNRQPLEPKMQPQHQKDIDPQR